MPWKRGFSNHRRISETCCSKDIIGGHTRTPSGPSDRRFQGIARLSALVSLAGAIRGPSRDAGAGQGARTSVACRALTDLPARSGEAEVAPCARRGGRARASLRAAPGKGARRPFARKQDARIRRRAPVVVDGIARRSHARATRARRAGAARPATPSASVGSTRCAAAAGTHARHMPPLHVAPGAHVPQLPPHPSDPQAALAAQLGTQVVTHVPPRSA